MDQMWAHYINENHPLSDSSLVDTVMLHHTVPYDPTLQHVYLDGNVNDEGFYRHLVTGKNISTIRCCHFCKQGEARNDHKLKTGCFWSRRLYNPFTQKLGLEMQFEGSADKSDIKDDSTKNTNIKEGSNDDNEQVSETDVETVDISGDDALQAFVSQIEQEGVMPELFGISALPEGASIFYISSEETNMFHPKGGQNVASEINI